MNTFVFGLLALVVCAFCQNVGNQKQEYHLPMSVQTCNADGTCQSQQHSVTLDSNWRWTHATSGYQNCYTGNTWDAELCPDADTCTRNCAVDGVDYNDWNSPYGVHAEQNGLRMGFVTHGQYGTNDADHYKLLHLKNHKFRFEIDVSQLPCGFNVALYFVEMDADGGKSKYSTNKARARYGTHYCDAQYPHDLKCW
jgi:cellulose 1,4-beta-cellobiosidase